MSEESAIRVNLTDRAYDIAVGSGTLASAAQTLLDWREFSHAVVVTDSNVDPLYGDPLADQLTEHDVEAHVMVCEAGEPSKSIDVVAELWESMLAEGTDRKSVVVAVGGGVVGDLAGFVAATYARGLTFFQVPTTLLAQVDSSVGGKTGINLPGAKNMVGSFWQPAGVLIDVDVLASLPEREFVAGLAEVVKYGVILDEEFFQYLEEHAGQILSRDQSVLTHIVRRSCELKATVVEQDEREETGLRAILNYGHTFCHAFETATDYEALLHGEAVSMGMMCAARLGEITGRVDSAFVERQQALLTALQLPLDAPDVDAGELIQLMRRDKKAAEGQLRFILPTRFGAVEMVGGIRPDDVRAALQP